MEPPYLIQHLHLFFGLPQSLQNFITLALLIGALPRRT
jgi:hypothetical protein